MNRLYGIDLARFLAVVGMMTAHLGTGPLHNVWIETVVEGLPSTLFAILGGFGVTFASQRYLREDKRLAAVVSTLIRGLMVIAIGLAVAILPGLPILVVLVPFGGAIIASSAFVLAPTWMVMVTAAVLAVVAPPLLVIFDTFGLSGSGAVGVISFALLSGTYPVITWTAYLLIGMVLARWTLRTRETGNPTLTAAAMMVGGTMASFAAQIASNHYLQTLSGPDGGDGFENLRNTQYGHPGIEGPGAWLVASPHSGSTADILNTGGKAAAIIGLCLLISITWRTAVPVVLRPLVSAGAATLTIYVLHLFMTSMSLVAAGGMKAFWSGDSLWWISWALYWQLAVVLILGGILAWLGKRGPLEALVSGAAKRVASLLA